LAARPEQSAHVPWLVPEPIIFSRKFLAIPETRLSPQVVLLAVLSPGAFVLADTLLAYAAFCAGVGLLCRRYGLSFVPGAFFFLLAGLNGHVTAQLAVGHSMWTASLPLPFFVLLACALCEDASSRATPVLLALVLSVILLQGALHVFAWCVLFLLLLAAFNPSRARAVLLALLWAGGLCALR